jgi:hypothetical protein
MSDPASPPIARLAARYARAARRDAEALLAVAAWPDLPAGVAVLPLYAIPEAAGISVGSGHALAIANGRRPGAVAVRVDAAGILRAAFRASGADAAAVVMALRPVIESVAVHELAHALTKPRDPVATPTEAAEFVAASLRLPLGTGAAAHCPRWAAAMLLLADRAARLRPAHERPAVKTLAREHLQWYGFDPAAVAEALGDVSDEASVRELLAPGGAAARRLAAACQPEPEREAVIRNRRSHGAAVQSVPLLERSV